jgi:hypothetical protein
MKGKYFAFIDTHSIYNKQKFILTQREKVICNIIHKQFQNYKHPPIVTMNDFIYHSKVNFLDHPIFFH